MKKRVKAKKVSAKKSKFFNSKAWVFVAVAAFIIALISLSFTNVPSSVSTTGNVVTGEAVKTTNILNDMFTGWNAGELDVTIAKYLYLMMVVLLIFSVLSMVKIPTQTTLQFILALIIGFLATAYITPDQVYVLLAEYNALGITLTFIVPFLILFLGSAAILNPIREGARVAIRRISIGQVLFVLFIWLSFTVFLVYRMIKSFANGVPWDDALGIIMIVMTILSFLILVFNGLFRRFIDRIAASLVREYNVVATNI